MLPLASRVHDAMAQWLAPAFGEIEVRPDLDRIDALTDERTALWARVNAASFLTQDEKREAVGYGALGQAVTVPPHD